MEACGQTLVGCNKRLSRYRPMNAPHKICPRLGVHGGVRLAGIIARREAPSPDANVKVVGRPGQCSHRLFSAWLHWYKVICAIVMVSMNSSGAADADANAHGGDVGGW